MASSTVMTPSLPTLLIASAMISPMVGSLLAEMVPTCAISFCSLVGLESVFSSATMAATALSMPRFRLIGSWPAATILSPSVKMARASTVAVVVPSPATSEVLRRDLLHHLGAHVLELVLELDLLGDRDAVLGDVGRAEGLLEDDVAARGAQGDRHRVREDVDAAQDAVARVLAELDDLWLPLLCSSFSLRPRRGCRPRA